MTPRGPEGLAELDLLPVGVAHIDATATIVRANRLLGELIGMPVEELVGRNMFDLAAGDLDRYVEMLDFGAGFSGTLMGPLTVRYRHADGSVRRSALWAQNHLDDPGVRAIVCAFVPDEADGGVADALSAIAQGEPVGTTLERLAEALRGNPFDATGCWLVRDGSRSHLQADGDLTDPVRAALSQSGRWWRATRSGELTTCDDTRHGDESDRMLAAAGVGAWWALPAVDDDSEAAIVVLRPEPGPISPNQREHLEQIVATAGLAFERASMQARLAHAAFHDPLTGLANRGRFFQRDDSRLPPGAALLYVDLDRFKPVNDQLGHTAGDLVLVTVADRIRRAVRPTDRITRFGGDEFVVECAGVGNDAEAVDIAERIIAAIQEPIRLDLAQISIDASVGIARTDEPVGLDDLLDRSDAALLAAKAAGRGRWHLADDG